MFWTDHNGYREPLRSHRWFLELTNAGFTSIRFALKECKKPEFDVNVTEHKVLNHVVKLPGILKWKPINIKFASVRGKDFNQDASSVIFKAMQSGGYSNPASYLQDALSKVNMHNALEKNALNIIQIDPQGNPIEVWSLFNATITGVNFGSLTYENEDIVNIECTINYDYAILNDEARINRLKLSDNQAKEFSSQVNVSSSAVYGRSDFVPDKFYHPIDLAETKIYRKKTKVGIDPPMPDLEYDNMPPDKFDKAVKRVTARDANDLARLIRISSADNRAKSQDTTGEYDEFKDATDGDSTLQFSDVIGSQVDLIQKEAELKAAQEADRAALDASTQQARRESGVLDPNNPADKAKIQKNLQEAEKLAEARARAMLAEEKAAEEAAAQAQVDEVLAVNSEEQWARETFGEEKAAEEAAAQAQVDEAFGRTSQGTRDAEQAARDQAQFEDELAVYGATDENALSVDFSATNSEVSRGGVFPNTSDVDPLRPLNDPDRDTYGVSLLGGDSSTAQSAEDTPYTTELLTFTATDIPSPTVAPKDEETPTSVETAPTVETTPVPRSDEVTPAVGATDISTAAPVATSSPSQAGDAVLPEGDYYIDIFGNIVTVDASSSTPEEKPAEANQPSDTSATGEYDTSLGSALRDQPTDYVSTDGKTGTTEPMSAEQIELLLDPSETVALTEGEAKGLEDAKQQVIAADLEKQEKAKKEAALREIVGANLGLGDINSGISAGAIGDVPVPTAAEDLLGSSGPREGSAAVATVDLSKSSTSKKPASNDTLNNFYKDSAVPEVNINVRIDNSNTTTTTSKKSEDSLIEQFTNSEYYVAPSDKDGIYLATLESSSREKLEERRRVLKDYEAKLTKEYLAIASKRGGTEAAAPTKKVRDQASQLVKDVETAISKKPSED